MTTQWGRPLTGAQMKWARLPVGTVVNYLGYIGPSEDFEFNSKNYRLPVSHIAYKVLYYNEKHGTNFVPWYGGDSAPDDWDGGKVLFYDGEVDHTDKDHSTSASPCWGRGVSLGSYDIIGYTVREEVKADPIDPSKVTRISKFGVTDATERDWNAGDVLRKPYVDDHKVDGPQVIEGTVTIPRMSNEEWYKLRHADLSLQAWAHRVGLIKPPTTREERFFNEIQTGRGNYSPEVLSVIQKALEFER